MSKIEVLIVLLTYAIPILILIWVSVKVVDYYWPKTDDHKKYKITRVTNRSQE